MKSIQIANFRSSGYKFVRIAALLASACLHGTGTSFGQAIQFTSPTSASIDCNGSVQFSGTDTFTTGPYGVRPSTVTITVDRGPNIQPLTINSGNWGPSAAVALSYDSRPREDRSTGVRVITATDDAGNSSQITITETGGVNDPRSNAILVKETVGTPLPCGNNADIENTVALPVSESISCLPQGVNNTPDTGYLTYQEGWDTQRGGETPTSYDNNPIPIGSGTEYDFDANGFITYPDFSTGPCPACPATDPGQWNYYQNIIISVYADAALSSLQNKFTFTDASCRHGYYGWYRNGKFSTPQQTEVNLKVYGGTVVATVDNHWPVNCAQSQ